MLVHSKCKQDQHQPSLLIKLLYPPEIRMYFPFLKNTHHILIYRCLQAYMVTVMGRKSFLLAKVFTSVVTDSCKCRSWLQVLHPICWWSLELCTARYFYCNNAWPSSPAPHFLKTWSMLGMVTWRGRAVLYRKYFGGISHVDWTLPGSCIKLFQGLWVQKM